MPTTTKQTFPARVQLEAIAGRQSAEVGVTVKLGFIVKQGDVLGKITADSKYRRRSRTTTAGTGFSNASPIGQVTDASVFVAGDALKKTDGTVIGTIAASGIDTVSNPNQVTLTGNSAINLAAANDVVASDGSQVAQGIADASTDGTADQAIAVMLSGELVESLLRGLDTSAKSELAGASMAAGIFKF
jgi:hypothetical protein